MKKYPVSQAQLGVILETLKHPESTQYNIPVCEKIDKRDIDEIVNSFSIIFKRHAILRNRFEMDREGTILQWPDDDMQIDIPRKCMNETEAAKYIKDIFCRPFNLFSGEPLFRIEVIETEQNAYLIHDIHHSVIDGFSYTMIENREIASLNGCEDVETEIQAYEFAENEQKKLESEEYLAAKNYVTGKFGGTNFVTLSGKAESETGKMIRHSEFLESARLDEWCRTRGWSADNLFQAAFSHVLGALSREEEVAYGCTFHGRGNIHMMRTCGMFVTNVPVSVKVSGETTVAALVDALREETAEAKKHYVYPTTRLAKDTGAYPKVSFNFRASKSMNIYLKACGKIYPSEEIVKPTMHDDLTVIIKLDSQRRYEICLESSGAMNSPEQIRSLGTAIKNTVLNMMENPDARLKDVKLVSSSEEAALIQLSQGAELTYDRTRTWIDDFRDQAAQQPDRTAVVDASGSYTYAELDRLSDLLAGFLASEGVREDGFTGIKLPRTKEFIAAVIAVHKTGAAYVPMDTEYPEERLRYMAEDSGAGLVIESLSFGKDSFCVNGRTVQNADVKLISSRCAPERRAYMIYTSGSTGKPKGVVIHQSALLNYTKWNIREKKTEAGRNYLHVPSFSFDISMQDIMSPLSVGATIHITANEQRKDTGLLADYINRHDITGFMVSTQTGMLLLNNYELNLDYMTLCGEKMLPVKKQKFAVFNEYGPTEFTVASSCHKVTWNEGENIPIGRAMPNTYSFICDRNGNLVPRGMTGEIYLCGVQIAEGYWNKSELTEKAFVDCRMISGSRMYRTGDLGRYNEDSELEIFGRIDHQVKLRGYRIELGEIEARTAQNEGVDMSVAVVKNNRLVLYYTGRAGAEELRSFLAETLTSYMVPDLFMKLDAMPLTPSGKIDRKRLPEPEVAEAEDAGTETALERELLKIVHKILETDRPGVMTNLLSAGMDSLRVMKLAVKIQDVTGKQVAVSELMKAQNVREIALLLESAGKEGRIEKAGKWELYPITENQRGLILDWEMNRDSLQYNIGSAFRLSDGVRNGKSAEEIASALERVIDAHPYLKTRFIQKDGEIWQTRHDDEKAAVICNRLHFEPDTEYFQKRMKPFNPYEDRLYRMEVVETDKNMYLYVDIHHTVFDGLSTGILLSAVLDELAGTPAKSEAVDSFDFAVYEDEQKRSPLYEAGEAYWSSLLSEAEPAAFRGSDTKDSRKSCTLKDTVPAGKIRSFCASNSVTEASFMNAAFACTLSRITRSEHVMYLTIENGRGAHPELESSIGMFVKTIPVVMVQKDGTTAGFVSAMQSELRESIRHDLYPYTRMVEKYGKKGTVMFAYQGGISESGGIEGLEAISLSLDTAKFPVSVTVYPEGESYAVSLEYDGTLFDSSDMNALEKAFSYTMLSLASEEKLCDVKTFSSAEEETALTELAVRGVPASVPFPLADEDAGTVAGTPLEKELLETACDILETKRLGLTTNLLSAGMNSLQIMKLAVKIQKMTGRQMPVSAIIMNPTIHEIALKIYEVDKREKIEQVEKITRREKIEYYPVTENQRGLILDWEMNRNSIQYNVAGAFRLSDEVRKGKSAEEIAGVIERVIDAHPYLKTRFVKKDGEIWQTRNDAEKAAVTLTKPGFEPDASYFQAKLRPFNLYEDRLYRIEVVETEKSVYIFEDIHHTIFDGISVNILFNDVLAGCEGNRISGESVDSYDFAIYEDEQKQSDAYVCGKEYWTRLLMDAEPAVIRESDRKEGKKSCTVESTMPGGRIRQFCAENGVTEASFMNAACARLLSAMTREENPMFLTVESGRGMHPELSGSVGMFVKTIPVVAGKVEGHTADYVKAVQNQLQESMSHDLYPYTKIVETSGKKGCVMFAYQGGLTESDEVEGMEIIPLSLDEAKLPVSVTVYPEGDLFAVEVEYDGTLFSASDMQALCRAFINVVLSMTQEEDVRDVKLTDSAEEAALMKLSEGAVLAYDRTRTWLDDFVLQAGRQPEKTAVTDRSGSISYGELNRESDLLAGFLVREGITADAFVGIRLPRVKEFITAIIAVHKAGAAYVPMDPAYPEERLRYMASDSGASLVIESLSFRKDSFLVNGTAVQSADVSVPVCRCAPERRAYMIYTSGSTGRPKGVLIRQSALLNYIKWDIDEKKLAPGKKNLHVVSFSFDMSVDDLMPPLSAGAEIHIADEEMRHDASLLAAYINRNGITGFSCPTNLCTTLLNNFDIHPEYVTAGGERFVPVRKQDFTVYNEYGPTEFTDSSTFHKVTDFSLENQPVGRPLPNMYAFICDREGHLMPEGMTGELCLSGLQIAAGYWNRPDLTEKAFVPCSMISGELMYRTGDLARYNADGNLEVSGRIDHQVKLRGFRIELGEIDGRAAQYEGVESAVSAVNGSRLVLYYTCGQHEVDEAGLKAFLAQSLTSWMVPDVFMKLDAMPLTPGGKIDRKQLPAPETGAICECVMPETEAEGSMLRIARELLPGIAFGVTDDLVHLGFNSIMLMMLTLKVNQQTGMEVSVADVMRYRTVRKILEGQNETVWFYSGFDRSRKTIVISLGIVAVTELIHLFELWKEQYNIIVINPVSAVEGRYCFDELMVRYLDDIERLAGEVQVDCFAGFSFGGEIALGLATLYAEKRGSLPSVLMGDTWLTETCSVPSAEIALVTAETARSEYLALRHQEIDDDMAAAVAESYNTVNRILSRKQMKSYSGRTVLIDARKNVSSEECAEKLTVARTYVENLEVVENMDYDHYEIYLDDQLDSFYDGLMKKLIS